jgi:hypothetical protein
MKDIKGGKTSGLLMPTPMSDSMQHQIMEQLWHHYAEILIISLQFYYAKIRF